MSEDKTAIDIKAEKAQARARADQANQEAAAAKPLDMTVAGGRYIVDGQVVDANGVAIKE